MSNVRERLKQCILSAFPKLDENTEINDETILGSFKIDELDIVELDMAIEEEFNIEGVRIDDSMSIKEIVDVIESKRQ